MMGLISEVHDATKSLRWTFSPTPQRVKDEYLDRVREKIAYYQPLMEQKCGISLGNIQVRDGDEWFPDFWTQKAHEFLQSQADKRGKFPNYAACIAVFGLYNTLSSVLSFPTALLQSFRPADMRYFDRALYVPFTYETRRADRNFTRRAETMDNAVVHELSHAIWEKLAPGAIIGFDEVEWYEGFATYCAEDYFADFYPPETEIPDLDGLWERGLTKMRELVFRHGPEVVLSVPKNWKKYANELAQSYEWV